MFSKVYRYSHPKSWYNIFTFAVLSNEPVATLSPKGLLNAKEYTTFLCPSNVNNSSPVCVFQILQVLS